MPVESLLENRGKMYPWYCSTTNVITTADSEAIHDYLVSGSIYSDIMVLIFPKKHMDTDVLQQYDRDLEDKIRAGKR